MSLGYGEIRGRFDYAISSSDPNRRVILAGLPAPVKIQAGWRHSALCGHSFANVELTVYARLHRETITRQSASRVSPAIPSGSQPFPSAA